MTILTTNTCGRCKALIPVLSKYCEENDIILHSVDANSTDGINLANTHGIRQVPVVLLYDDAGNLQKLFTGDVSLKTIKDYIAEIKI